MSNWSYDQLSLFEEKSPARFVAEIAQPYWTTSAERIIEDAITFDVNYCPVCGRKLTDE